MSATPNPLPGSPAPSWDAIEDALAAAREDALILRIVWEWLGTDGNALGLVHPNSVARVTINRAIERTVASIVDAYALRFGGSVLGADGGGHV